MYIKEIKLSNFRIYKNQHQLHFTPEQDKNVFLIAGNNGYGKTTFLTALVWCLYGKHMKDVDEVYKSRINEAGGYPKFIQSCLNRLAYSEGDRDFEVSISFLDIDVPSLPCNEITITRKGNYNSGNDEVIIIIDGHENELTREVGNDVFIQDFILPKEVAKFFFFDSEKIVALAESKSIAAKRQLSKAYSEVLGIQKYVNLKNNLQDLIFRFKRDSAKPADKKKFDLVQKELGQLKAEKYSLEDKLEGLEEDRVALRKQSEILQEKLIREGSALSIDEINNLEIDKNLLKKKIEELKETFKTLLDFAPFAIVGNLLTDVKKQLDKERKNNLPNNNQEILNKKGQALIKAFKKIKPKDSLKVNKTATKFYQEELEKLVDKYLVNEPKTTYKKTPKVLHDFSEEEFRKFSTLYLQLKTTYASQVKEISTSLSKARLEYGRISTKLSDAESKESDGIIAKFRAEKKIVDKDIAEIESNINSLNQEIGSIQPQVVAKQRVADELEKKITVQERYVEKNKLAKRLIGELETFIAKIKIEKKAALEEKILHSLKSLMHKKKFVKKVVVDVGEDIININLIDYRNKEIDKDTLSKGEQQLYATSILKALVEESNIEFPVFIDSPLQKFDAAHARNIIANFYPDISKQVVLFPLLEKELSKEEYELIQVNLKAAYLIKQNQKGYSEFLNIDTNNIFKSVA